jgi:tetratricopeptide (TPR) repeat protein
LHVSFADHRIPSGAVGREKGKPAEVKAADSGANSKGESDDVVIFDGVDQRLPELEVNRARAFMLVGGTEHSGPTPSGARRAERLLLPVIDAHPDDVDALEVLGTACFLQRRVADAERYWQAALQRDPRRETTLHHLAVIKYEQRQMAAARDLLQRYLDVNPRFGTMHAKYAGALGALGDWPACIAAAERALERNPTLASAHELLAYAYRQTGKPVESERHRRLFEQLQRLVPRAAVEE